MELYFRKSIALIVIILFVLTLIIKHIKLMRKTILRGRKFILIKRVIRYAKMFLNLKIICIFICAVIVGEIYTKHINYKYDNLYLGLEKGDFIGVIQSQSEKTEYNTKYKIKVQSINGDFKYKNTNLYLTINNNLEELEYGDLVSFKGEYIKPEEQRNHGGFSYKEYLKTLKIYGTVKCIETKIDIYEKNKANIISLKLNELSKIMKENTYKLFKEEEANLLIGILLGDTTGINDDVKDDFRNSSLIHILAVSGSHINYIILSLLYINNKTNLNKRIGSVITIIVLLLFMFLVGFTPSVLRSVLMGITIIISKLVYKKLDIINSVSFSALILLIINPFNIINTGFLLSYGGTIGIVSLSSNIKKVLIKEKEEKSLITVKRQFINNLIKSITEILALTISAQIIIMPIIARLFNTVSLTFFISNLITSPLMGVITILGFITIFISFISISISKVLSMILTILLKFLFIIADFFGGMKISKIYVITIPIAVILVYYIIIYFLNYYIFLNQKKLTKREKKVLIWFESIKYNFKRNHKKILIVCIIIVVSFNLFSNITRQFKIYFIDVGQR